MYRTYVFILFILTTILIEVLLRFYPAQTLWVERLFLAYFVLIIGVSTLKIILSIGPVLSRKCRRFVEFDKELFGQKELPKISVIVPAYNERLCIEDTVHSLLGNAYPNLEIIVINDGSKDNTLSLLVEKFGLIKYNTPPIVKLECKEVTGIYRSADYPKLVVVDKINGGSKADASNAGIQYSTGPLIAVTDADTIMEKDCFFRLVEPYIYSDKELWAVGGSVLLKNHCKIENNEVTSFVIPKSQLAKFQILEYLRAFLYGRIGLNQLGGNFIVSGAFGLFLRQPMIEAGAYNPKALGEDIDLVMRLHILAVKKGVHNPITYLPDPVCYTEAPEDIKTLENQRDRWQRGLISTLYRYRIIFFNPKYGARGWVIFPYYFFIEMLSPVIEFVAYALFFVLLAFHSVNTPFAIFFFVSALVSGFLINMMALILDRFGFNFFKGTKFRLILVLTAIFENFGHRQMTVFFRMEGTIKYIIDSILKKESGWGEMKRKGSA